MTYEAWKPQLNLRSAELQSDQRSIGNIQFKQHGNPVIVMSSTACNMELNMAERLKDMDILYEVDKENLLIADALEIAGSLPTGHR